MTSHPEVDAEDAGGRGVDRVEMERAEEQRSESDAADRAESADQAALEQATAQEFLADCWSDHECQQRKEQRASARSEDELLELPYRAVLLQVRNIQ